jgi:cbb3-type cytochrome oxidase subunit 3
MSEVVEALLVYGIVLFLVLISVLIYLLENKKKHRK